MFAPVLTRLKDQISSADLAIGNLETSVPLDTSLIQSHGWNGTLRPAFGSPKEWVETLKWAGFDLVSTANNHLADTGLSGVKGTIEALNEYGIAFSGTRSLTNSKKNK